MELLLDKIKLRKPKEKDKLGFIKICAEVETMKYYGISGANIKTIEQASDQLNWCIDLFNYNSGRWIITELDNDDYIGDIGFHNFSREHNKVEIGYRLLNEYWNRGIITTCIKALLEVGFSEFKYNRIEALLDSRNIGCIRVLKKNNFVMEGTLRQYEFENNEYIDMLIFSILKDEYKIHLTTAST